MTTPRDKAMRAHDQVRPAPPKEDAMNRNANCRYCERYNHACGRAHTEATRGDWARDWRGNPREAQAQADRQLARGGQPFAVAWDRDEPAPCERNTPGCCVWHAVEDACAGGHDGCECW